MSFLTIVIIFALELRLTIVSSVKVYKSRIVTVRYLISLFIVILLKRLTGLLFLSGVSSYRLIERLLSFTFYLSFIKSVNDSYYKLYIIG